MIYTLIGAGSTFFALLPFLFILFKMVKTRDKKTYAIGVLLFLLALVVVVAITTYALYNIHPDTLIGEGVVVIVYLVIFLWMFLIRRYKFRKLYRNELMENDEDDYEDASYELFEDDRTMVVSRPDLDEELGKGRQLEETLPSMAIPVEDPFIPMSKGASEEDFLENLFMDVEEKEPEKVSPEKMIGEGEFLEEIFSETTEEVTSPPKENLKDDDIDNLSNLFK